MQLLRTARALRAVIITRNMEFDDLIGRRLRSLAADRGANYLRAIDLGLSVLAGLKIAGFRGKSEKVEGHDLHIFFDLGPEKGETLHVQIYPGMSTDNGVVLTARILDTARMNEIRALNQVSKGNEHAATTEVLIPQSVAEPFPWDDNVITNRLVAALSNI